MKKIHYLLWALFLGGIGTLNAQVFERTVIGVAGASSEAGLTQLSWTAGEAATTTVTAGTFVLNQGFQQTNPPFSSGIEDELGITIDYKVYPNPTNDWVKIAFTSDKPVELVLELWDIQGRKTSIPSQTLLVSSPSETQFDLSSLSSGIYHLSIRASGGELGKTFQIQKLN